MGIEIEIEVVLAEAYYSADNETPSVLLRGAGIGKHLEGPVEVAMRGVGVKLDGLRIGQRYRLSLEPVADRVLSLAAVD